MVQVTTNGLFDGPFTKLFKDLYIKYSDKDFQKEVPYPKTLKPYLDDLYGCYDLDYEFTEDKFPISVPKRKYDAHDERVLVAFSGGKDSVAIALILKDLGYKPTLWFTKGINRSYSNNEFEAAKRLAKRMNMELIVYTVKVSGKCEFQENPVKNQFILAPMVDYGLKKGIVNYSFGTYLDDYLDEISTDYMLSDGTFMFQNVLDFYQAYVPEMDILIWLYGGTDAWYEICKHDTQLLLDTYSCMTPLRYKKNIMRRNEEKYGIKLLKNRCGSCYKCCNELYTLNDFGVLDYPQKFLDHCKEITWKFYEKYKTPESMEQMKSATDWVDPIVVEDLKKHYANRKGYKIDLEAQDNE